ncbi:hypothetical protein [Streptomyces lavendofoliae]|uniref:hypothetical protein n=1 Tax=Streptomyces lavendofoliae TaxID=67314 RepID=UPI003D910146
MDTVEAAGAGTGPGTRAPVAGPPPARAAVKPGPPAMKAGPPAAEPAPPAAEAWYTAPLRVFVTGALLMSVLSHGFEGGYHLVVMLAGGALQLAGAVWGVAARLALRNPGTDA